MDGRLNTPTFECVYPEIVKACERLGIYTPMQFLDRIRVAAKVAAQKGLWVEEYHEWERKLQKSENPTSSLLTLLKGKRVNPWDAGRQRFRLLAIFIGFTLGRHPTYLFGASRKLEKLNGKIYEIPTLQREYTHKLLREAYNPFTQDVGISYDDLRKLSAVGFMRQSAPAFLQITEQRKQITEYLEARSGGSRRGIAIFDSETGSPTAWGCDFTSIVDGESVEQTFPYGAEAFEAREGAFLPMFRYRPLEDAVAIPAQHSFSALHYKEIAFLIREAGKSLTEKQKKVLIMRIQAGLTLEECGQRVGGTRENVRQIEARALSKMRKVFSQLGIEDSRQLDLPTP